MQKSSTPMILLVLAFVTLVNTTIHVSIIIPLAARRLLVCIHNLLVPTSPCIYKGLIASLKLTKALLQTAFAGLEKVGVESAYYFYPIDETNPLDTLTGALLSDLAPRRPLKSSLARKILIGATGLGRVVAAFGRAGGRICE